MSNKAIMTGKYDMKMLSRLGKVRLEYLMLMLLSNELVW